LLVEFAAKDRFHRAIMFPFIKGYAENSGITTHWLRFAVPASSAFLQESADRDKLGSVIKDFGPDVVILSHTPSVETLEALGAAGPQIRILDLSQTAEAEWMQALGWQDLKLMETAAPDYGFEPANPEARNLRPLPFVFIGEECTFGRSFASNPFFAGLPLSDCIRAGGCAFCTRPEHRGHWETEPLVLLRRQLEAIARTLPGADRGLEVRLVGEQVIENIQAVAEEAKGGGSRPLQLLIDCRADRFVRSADSFRRALESLESSGCRFELCLMGVENFSSRELGRLNKGLDPATNLRAIGQLFELEQAFPSSFGFRTHGGLSLITFTPWTTSTELILNLMVVRLLGLEQMAGKLLTGRLRLHAGLPLTEAARRDGLLIERYSDPLLDTARLNMYEPEIPWKFAQPEIEELNRVLLRLSGDIPLDHDPLARKLAGLGAARGSTRAAVRLADEALRAAWTGSLPPAEELIDSALGPAQADQALPTTFEQWTRYADARREDLELQLELKPVSKLEPVSADDLKKFESDPAFPNLQCRQRGFGDQKEVYEVFFGRRREDVQEALQVAEQLETLGGEGFTRALIRMGLLLGYPECCVKAFAGAPQWLQDNFFWLHVMRRIEAPQEVPGELNPGGTLLEYVPCSTACAESLKRTERILARMPAGGAWADRQAWLERQRNPWLVFWALQGKGLELIPEDPPAERFRYRAGTVKGTHPLLKQAAPRS
jgi:hypothetical protein